MKHTNPLLGAAIQTAEHSVADAREGRYGLLALTLFGGAGGRGAKGCQRLAACRSVLARTADRLPFGLGRYFGAAKGARAGKDAFEHGLKYHPRVRARGIEDPVAHNFPYSFDDVILKEKPIIQSNGSLLYRKAGSINDKNGVYEIAVNPKTKTIFHRTWRSR